MDDVKAEPVVATAEPPKEAEKPKPLQIILELTEHGAVRVSWSEGITRIVAFGMLEDAKHAIVAHYEKEAMRKEMLRQKLAKPGLAGFGKLFKK